MDTVKLAHRDGQPLICREAGGIFAGKVDDLVSRRVCAGYSPASAERGWDATAKLRWLLRAPPGCREFKTDRIADDGR